MNTRDYGLVELPNAERHGSIWAILSADATIDVDKHLGDLGPQLAKLDYTTFGYHDYREFESEVSWKGALEEFADAYHFPLVHGQRHHRIGFPFHWIAKLAEDPKASWDVRDNMGVICWICPNLILANSSAGVEVIDILPAGSPTRCTVRHSWLAWLSATKISQCFRSAEKVCATVNMTT